MLAELPEIGWLMADCTDRRKLVLLFNGEGLCYATDSMPITLQGHSDMAPERASQALVPIICSLLELLCGREFGSDDTKNRRAHYSPARCL